MPIMINGVPQLYGLYPTLNVSADGKQVSIYSLVYTADAAYVGGVLAPNGDIHFVPFYATVGQKISTVTVNVFSQGICESPWLNKL